MFKAYIQNTKTEIINGIVNFANKKLIESKLIEKASISRDGNQWACVISHAEFPMCLMGFGDTPEKAVKEMIENYYNDDISKIGDLK